jgi:pilus assembly protein CpaF
MSFDVILPFLGPIRQLLEAATVSEVMINPDSSIWVEEEGTIRSLPGLSFDKGALLTSLEVIANRFGKKLDADSPIMNVRLPDGSRLAALIPPIVHPSPLLTIRKFTSRGFTIEDLISRRTVTRDQASSLAESVRRGDNLLISGGTGSG